MGGKLVRAREGVTSVEFAVTASSFLMLLLGMFYLSMTLWASANMQCAVEAAARCSRINVTDVQTERTYRLTRRAFTTAPAPLCSRTNRALPQPDNGSVHVRLEHPVARDFCAAFGCRLFPLIVCESFRSKALRDTREDRAAQPILRRADAHPGAIADLVDRVAHVQQIETQFGPRADTELELLAPPTC